MCRRRPATAARSGWNTRPARLACATAIETTILGEGPQTVAEVIVEPIMSGVGVAVPPDEYLPKVEEICRKYDVLLHVDEVINGFGRTGKMFAHQHYGISPDIMAVAKGIVSRLPADRRDGGEEPACSTASSARSRRPAR